MNRNRLTAFRSNCPTLFIVSAAVLVMLVCGACGITGNHLERLLVVGVKIEFEQLELFWGEVEAVREARRERFRYHKVLVRDDTSDSDVGICVVIHESQARIAFELYTPFDESVFMQHLEFRRKLDGFARDARDVLRRRL